MSKCSNILICIINFMSKSNLSAKEYYPHFEKRLKQRYDLDISWGEYRKLTYNILLSPDKYLLYKDKQTIFYCLIPFKKKLLIAVLDTGRKSGI